jgi:hypothetical protein
MKIGTFVLLAILFFPQVTYSGKINGTLRQDGRSVGHGVPIQITCAQEAYPGKTNERGAYSIYVNETGNCSFELPGFPGARHPINSYLDPVRYDFELVKQGDGYVLRRR